MSSYYGTFTWITPPQAKLSSGKSLTTEAKDDSKKELHKDIRGLLNLLRTAGLPNEVSELSLDILDMYYRLENYSRSMDDRSWILFFTSVNTLLNTLKFNADMFNKTYQRAQIKDSLNEVAINLDGSIWVQKVEDGTPTIIKPQEYLNNKDNYVPMTNSLLLSLRSSYPGFINRNDLLNTVSNAISTDEVMKLIKSNLVTLGSDDTSTTFLYNYKAKQGAKELELLVANASQLMPLDGLYEIKKVDKSSLRRINMALNTILTMLPQNAKTLLILLAGSPEGAVKLISDYITMGLDENHSISITQTKDKFSENKSGSQKEEKATFLTSLQNGYGNRRETRTLNLGSLTNFKVTGTVYGAFLDTDGNVTTNNTLLELLAKTGIAGISNSKSITFGNTYLTPNLLRFVAVENNGGFWAVLPCIKEGGKSKPNFELIEKYDSIVQKINEEYPNANYEERKRILEQKLSDSPELEELLDISGQLDENKFLAFFIVDGLASDLNVDLSNTSYIKLTSDKNDNSYFKTVTKLEDFDEENSIIGDSLFGTYDKLYKGSIYIPIQTTNRLAAIIFSGQKVDESIAMEIEQEYQNSVINNYRNSSTDLLFK